MPPKTLTNNTLFYGDNLPILREYIADESVDLIYLDPPFNSNRSYNVLFKDEGGVESESQIQAFDDTWHWNAETSKVYNDLLMNAPTTVAEMLSDYHGFLGEIQLSAYLVMMADAICVRCIAPTMRFVYKAQRINPRATHGELNPRLADGVTHYQLHHHKKYVG